MADTAAADYRIEELARRAGTTVRNVRSYRDRGLLDPPRRDGRLALYDDSHLSRLRLISALLDRGYTLNNIAELLAAWENGRDLAQILGLEDALVDPHRPDAKVTLTRRDLEAVLGEPLTPAMLSRFAALDVFAVDPVDPDMLQVRNPDLLDVGIELLAAGVPFDSVIDLGVTLRADVDRIASTFADVVNTYVVGPVEELPPSSEVPRLAEVIGRMRPLAHQAVVAELSRAMDRRMEAELGQRVGRMLAQIEAMNGETARAAGPGAPASETDHEPGSRRLGPDL